MADNILKIGDKVNWKNGWGKEEAEVATVKSIEVCELGEKYGDSVQEISWDEVHTEDKNIIVTLTNSHWAYGYQIDKNL